MYKLLEDFIDYLKYQKNYSEHTIDNYKKDILEYNIFLEENKYLYSNVDYAKCVKYLNYLNDKKLSKTSISRKLSSLRTFYKYLVLNQKMDSNPFLLISSPKKEKKLPKYINYNNIDEIFSIPNMNTTEGQRQRLILEILYSCGIRISELVNIKIKDIDFDDRTIIIFGKGSKERIVRFGDYANDILKLYINNTRDKLLKGIKSDYL